MGAWWLSVRAHDDDDQRSSRNIFRFARRRVIGKMKNLVHCFSRQVVSDYLGSLTEPKSGKNFEFIAALCMQRLYENQWEAPTMIGFYMKRKWHELFLKAENPSPDLLLQALKNG